MAVIRPNYRSLNSAQRQAFVATLLKFKRDGNPATRRNYDTYVDWHLQMMQLPMSQMRAHMSPMFLPWHREFLRLLELDLQAVAGDPAFAIPYWDWSGAGAGADETLWNNDFMGGNGRTSDLKVMTGPFAFDQGNWPIVHDDTGMSYLSRAFGSSSAATTLPAQADVDAAVAISTYDVTPWSMESDIALSFRNNLEGWGSQNPRLHNQVHVWVGGERATMAGGASPNDPVFFLHHANIDRIWASWQDASSARVYLPASEDPVRPGVSREALMPIFPIRVRPLDVLDYRALGYRYDTSPVLARTPIVVAPAAPNPAAPGVAHFRPFRGLIR